ncbi:rifin PIR protein, putative [Plasmodium reichenowi]|uniref:Rifin PIR protein, putative n=1 Tax=Plasmodium reichenowi TaxID=5854 RepID=A0A2P9DSE2_PLARE|nr:rifin PIR protein, putative [Plasmodium reichenowi]
MKLHYSKILLFVLPLNILLTSYHEYNKNKPSITPHHTPIYTSRVLSEKDIESSIYDKEAEINSVKENFDRQTSQRFQEYEERMNEKRQKRKEEREKNIEEIIKKDKMDKSLADKIEKGCLKCGCALGGGVLPVWCVVSGLWYATWSQYVTKIATDAGIKAGIATVVSELEDVAKQFANSPFDISEMVNAETYRSAQTLITYIYEAKGKVCEGNIVYNAPVCTALGPSNNSSWFNTEVLDATAKGIADTKTVQAHKLAELTAESSHLYSAIGYSILAILIIVLVMIIIYLILRYRRKKKMKKKAQYTKLLNE